MPAGRPTGRRLPSGIATTMTTASEAGYCRQSSVRRAIYALLAGLLIAGHAPADDSRLIVNIQGIRDSAGDIRASLYGEADGFRKEDRALKVLALPAAKGNVKVVFDGLAPGRYAIMAYHDENADHKLNLRFGMFPTEAYGLSNNPKVIGPPKFADSAFDVAGPETSIDIRLAY